MARNDVTYVLIVDDDADIRRTLRLALNLTDARFLVTEAPDGLVAWDVLCSLTQPAVVITNHQMPHLDGPGLMTRILGEPSVSERVALIYMTAHSGGLAPAVERLLVALSVRVIRKPFGLEDILGAVADAEARLRAPMRHAEPAAGAE